MISHELAKKLKDNGFPQKQFDPYIPTLSELIEACGKDFSFLENKSSEWLVLSRSLSRSGIGSSPEEAAANLWLELNKK